MLLCAVCAIAEENAVLPTKATRKPLVTGRQVGELVPSFYSRVVTGPLMNRSVCYVCRNGDRPVVLVLMRKTGPRVKQLLRNLDRIVDRNRAAGLRSFGVLLSSQPAKDTGALQTFSFNGKIAMPLTVTTETAGGQEFLQLPENADVSVVLYRNRRVVSSFAFRAGGPAVDEIRQVLRRAERLADDMDERAKGTITPGG